MNVAQTKAARGGAPRADGRERGQMAEAQVTTTEPEPYRLLSADSVAEALGVSKRQVWRLRSAGRLPEPVRIGRCVRWRAADLAEWVRDGCRNPEKFS